MDVRGCRLLVCVLVVLGAFVAAPVAVAAEIPGDRAGSADAGEMDADAVAAFEGDADAVAALQEDAEARPSGYDELRYEIELHDDGSATWTVEYRYRLDGGDENEVDWEALRDDVDAREGDYLDSFERGWQEQLDEAENETDRSMALSGFTLESDESTTPPEYGTIRFSFEWESFASVEVNRIDAGDALVGFDLDERTRLVVTWPESYDPRDNVTAVEPTPDDSRETAVVWHGSETEFLDGEPRIDLIEGDPSPEEPDRSVPLSLLAAVGVAVMAVIGAVGWLAVRDGAEPNSPSESAGGEPPSDDRGGPPRELLSNEEQVLELLEERGGRIKQQEVVAELDWTEAKTSQVVNGLREEGDVDVFRIGRENVLTLPDDE